MKRLTIFVPVIGALGVALLVPAFADRDEGKKRQNHGDDCVCCHPELYDEYGYDRYDPDFDEDGAFDRRNTSFERTVTARGGRDFIRLMREAGLSNLFNSRDTLTFFVPTDFAFDRLRDRDLSELRRDRDALRGFLLSHIVKGRLSLNDMKRRRAITTMAGTTLHVTRTRRGGTRVSDAAFARADIRVSNDTVHMMEEVLLNPYEF